MHTVAEIRVEPIGSGRSVSHIIERACTVLMQSGLRCHVHEMGTNVEGELSQVLETIEEVHRRLHQEGVGRISTRLDLETRTDKERHLGWDTESAQDFEMPAPRLA